MSITGYYEAKLKARRWIEPIVLGPGDITPLARDMAFIVRTLEDASREVDRLKKSNAALREDRRPPIRTPSFCRASKAAQSVKELAEQILSSAGRHPEGVAVFRQSGRVKWQPAEREVPPGVDFIGTFTEGADYRDVVDNLEAA